MIRLYKEEKGAVTLLVAFMMVVFIGITAVVIDGGHLYLKKSTLQKAVDAAALAGAQELPTNYQRAIKEAYSTLEKNNVRTSDVNITFSNKHTMINVSVIKTVPLFYGGFFGYENVDVKANGTVQLQTLTSAIGTVPLGVKNDTDLSFGDTAYLKVGDSTIGNFGALALTGTGASNFEADLKEGYKHEVFVGEKLGTQTGNIVGPTQRAIEDRIKRCPMKDATYTNHPSVCPRIVMVPVFEPVKTERNQIREVKVIGFASFFIEGMDGNDVVVGRFIENTFAGSMDPTAENFGTYSFKIVQ
ncbi:hypothetical protein BKP35_01305 [Anaerobacillus arseniciselenatis]|uniref:Putative Flp pilus-assembly TadG-like N-terminal domain-containing protein n=1 Tax=Anaerobacillus arseniciselenatis TaxID=85682 RepID=A0A1S2LT19_9BACI|nr:pilus assembly protein TadG-related protein [Anaerobacillus arseniciselenatis]OIJ15661.1 hypothetical protein BKP35_01305 [Anaerobacillus arseniciselenatis]